MMIEDNMDSGIVAETDNFAVWRSDEGPQGQYFHVALGGMTLHLTSEEWNELVLLIKSADV